MLKIPKQPLYLKNTRASPNHSIFLKQKIETETFRKYTEPRLNLMCTTFNPPFMWLVMGFYSTFILQKQTLRNRAQILASA